MLAAELDFVGRHEETRAGDVGMPAIQHSFRGNTSRGPGYAATVRQPIQEQGFDHVRIEHEDCRDSWWHRAGVYH